VNKTSGMKPKRHKTDSGLITGDKLTKAELKANHARMCEIMECPLTGPVPVGDLFDFLNEMRRKRGEPEIDWGAIQTKCKPASM
jgi:hypothetical protein